MRFYICGGKGILNDVSPAAICIWVHYKYIITSIEGHLLSSNCIHTNSRHQPLSCVHGLGIRYHHEPVKLYFTLNCSQGGLLIMAVVVFEYLDL